MEGEEVQREQQVVMSQLSHAGASVETPVPLPAGTKVIVSFCLSEIMSPLTLRGTVLNNATIEPTSRTTGCPPATPRRVEIQFTDLSLADQSRIKGWILTNRPKPFDASQPARHPDNL
jgi:hypothetical protein